MSSREIAELTGKEHKNPLAGIRLMLDQLGMHSADFSAQYRDSTGRTLPMFALPKELTLTLVAGYSAPLRHRIVTRWLELGQAQAARPVVSLPNFMDPAEAAIAWADEFKAKQAAVAQATQFKQFRVLALAASKTEAFDTFIHSCKSSLVKATRYAPGLNSQPARQAPFGCCGSRQFASVPMVVV